MEIGFWIALGLLALAVIVLLCKVVLLQRSADAIGRAFADRLSATTNTLIDLPGRDRHMQRLAAEINVQLRLLRRQRQRFEQGDAELKEAVTNIAHDLRTPLTAISGYLQVLEKAEKSAEVNRCLGMIANRTEAMTGLTEELFRYSVLTCGREPEAALVAVNDVLEESLAAAYGVLTRQNIVPVIRITDKRVERMLDPSDLARVFGNILANAVKYSDGDLEVTMDDDGTVIFANTAAALDAVSVGKLFDRFYTVESGRSSTGLGLSIARQLTERMGGSVWAELHDGRLSVCLRFPALNA